MEQRFFANAACLLILLGAASSPVLALDSPIVLDPPALVDFGAKEGPNSEIRYQAQPAKEGRIDLTANNGFFDRCFQALDEQPVIPGDQGLINYGFGYLGRSSENVSGTVRWHLWCVEAGEIKASFFMQVPTAEAGHPWAIRVGDETQTLKVNPSDGQSPQMQALKFTVKQPGKVTFTIDCTQTPPPAETRIRFIRLEGSAINKANLLRTRWRPTAVSGRFFAPGNCPEPMLWVFESANVGETGGYSPLMTPFGYFGTSFGSGGRIPPGSDFNFSMWIGNRHVTNAPPIEKMMRLIGTDIPEAEYSSWGNAEGTGVKFRKAVAYKDGADRTIQAFRVEETNDVRTYYGYFYDEQANRWRLFASGQGPAGSGKSDLPNRMKAVSGFCEIPGPPHVERSGDLVREIKRRGWFYGSDNRWYRAQTHPDAKTNAVAATAKKPANKPQPQVAKKVVPESRRFYEMDDYDTEGWTAMATGGMELYLAREKPVQKDGTAAPLPEYLSPEKTAQLFDLPVHFGVSKASAVSADQATIDYEIKKTGPNSKAILYYGTVDSVTYPAREVTEGSAVQIDMYRPERTWQSATPEQPVTAGMNSFKLGGLTADTTYYYRLFVTHDRGKSWDYKSGSFKTQ